MVELLRRNGEADGGDFRSDRRPRLTKVTFAGHRSGSISVIGKARACSATAVQKIGRRRRPAVNRRSSKAGAGYGRGRSALRPMGNRRRPRTVRGRRRAATKIRERPAVRRRRAGRARRRRGRALVDARRAGARRRLTSSARKPSDASPALQPRRAVKRKIRTRSNAARKPALEARSAPDLPPAMLNQDRRGGQPSPASPSPAQSPAMPAGQTPAAGEPTTKARRRRATPGRPAPISEGGNAEVGQTPIRQIGPGRGDRRDGRTLRAYRRAGSKARRRKRTPPGSASGAQMAALSATLERLAGRLDAIESKLAAPKSEQRAPNPVRTALMHNRRRPASSSRNR